MVNSKKVLDEVMIRLEKQFLVPAVYTLKEKVNGETDVQVFLHGTSASHFSSIEFIKELVVGCEEELHKVNKLADYFIDFFIHALQKETQDDAIDEVASNLAYVYEQMVQAHHWYDEKSNEYKVSFIPFKPEMTITLNARQLKEEYNHRFNSEDSPDILVDLKNMISAYEKEGIQHAKKLAEKLDRNIEVTSFDENKGLKNTIY